MQDSSTNKKGFSINIGAFIPPISIPYSTLDVEGGKLKIGLTKKVYMPIFVDSTYELGYIFGAFLSCGIANLSDTKGSSRGIVIFRPKKPRDLTKLKKCIKDVFWLEGKERDINLFVYSVPLTRLFKEFGIRKGRHLPQKYRVNNKDYNDGIIAGMDDYEALVSTNKRRIVSLFVKELYNELTA